MPWVLHSQGNVNLLNKRLGEGETDMWFVRSAEQTPSGNQTTIYDGRRSVVTLQIARYVSFIH
jgi:hypothetical protein